MTAIKDIHYTQIIQKEKAVPVRIKYELSKQGNSIDIRIVILCAKVAVKTGIILIVCAKTVLQTSI